MGRAFTATAKGRAVVLSSEVYISIGVGPRESRIGHKFRAIWDTGATTTCITPRVAKTCQLSPTGVRQVRTATQLELKPTYLVGVGLPNKVHFDRVTVIEANIGDDADVLVGMDIIGSGDFAVSKSSDGCTMFSYRYPSETPIDFVATPEAQKPLRTRKIGRNDPCHCGSGKKYKHCHGMAAR